MLLFKLLFKYCTSVRSVFFNETSYLLNQQSGIEFKEMKGLLLMLQHQ